jgi:Lon protease-like protein
MAEEVVEVIITPDGRVEMHVKGVEGMACLEVTKELEQLLGGEVEHQELTQEAYQGITEEQQRQQWT